MPKLKVNAESLQIGSPAAVRYRAQGAKLRVPGGSGMLHGRFGNHSDTMSRLSRRSFLAASALLAARPAFAAKPSGEDADVIVVGAGAAGIAAARRLAADKVRVLVFEAQDRIGGRCITDTKTFAMPFDLGAHWIHNPDSNPLLAAAPPPELYAAPRWQSVRIGARAARDPELEVFLAAQVRAQRALHEPTKAKTDVPATRALPDNLGPWKSSIEFLLGPYALSKDLNEVSAADLMRTAEHSGDSFATQGYGALLARLASGLTIRRSRPVSMIAWGKSAVLETPESLWYPRAIILTCSTNALLGDDIEFIPPLPKRVKDAAAQLALGSLDHIALDMPGNPLALQKDELVIEQSTGPRTAALLANVSGTGLHVITVGGAFGRELASKGERAMIDFAVQWVGSIFGTDVKRYAKKAAATNWNAQDYIKGAMSAASPGHADARRVLFEPLGHIWLSGEAVHETKWGTVEGAWESGVRAAEAVLRQLGRGGAREEELKRRRKRR
jgi:monoamine oxidase